MRAYQVFAAMTAEGAASLLAEVEERLPGLYAQAVGAASSALKSRPVYLMRKSRAQRAEAIRRTLSRVRANAVAEELLAAFFLDCRKELLVEWLEAVGLEHEDGFLQEDAPAEPPEPALREAVDRFRQGAEPEARELLLRAFAAQSAVEWPCLDQLVAPEA